MSNFAWMIKNNTPQEQLVHLNIDKLLPNPKNFYEIDGIDGLAHSIELTQSITPLTVIPIAGTDQYKILEGHRRYTACKKLIEEGKRTVKTVPCLIKRNLSEREETIQLINSNRQQRERTIFEKIHELEELEPFAREDYEKEGAKGSFRAFFADWLGENYISESSLQRILAIKNLITALVALVDTQELSLTAAAILGSKPVVEQYQFYNDFMAGRVSLRLADIKIYFMPPKEAKVEEVEPEEEKSAEPETDVQVEHDLTEETEESKTETEVPAEPSPSSDVITPADPIAKEETATASDEEVEVEEVESEDDVQVEHDPTEENPINPEPILENPMPENTSSKYTENYTEISAWAKPDEEEVEEETEDEIEESEEDESTFEEINEESEVEDIEKIGTDTNDKEIEGKLEESEVGQLKQTNTDTDDNESDEVIQVEPRREENPEIPDEKGKTEALRQERAIKWLINTLSSNIALTLSEKIELEKKFNNEEQLDFYTAIQQRLMAIIDGLRAELEGGNRG